MSFVLALFILAVPSLVVCEPPKLSWTEGVSFFNNSDIPMIEQTSSADIAISRSVLGSDGVIMSVWFDNIMGGSEQIVRVGYSTDRGDTFSVHQVDVVRGGIAAGRPSIAYNPSDDSFAICYMKNETNGTDTQPVVSIAPASSPLNWSAPIAIHPAAGVNGFPEHHCNIEYDRVAQVWAASWMEDESTPNPMVCWKRSSTMSASSPWINHRCFNVSEHTTPPIQSMFDLDMAVGHADPLELSLMIVLRNDNFMWDLVVLHAVESNASTWNISAPNVVDMDFNFPDFPAAAMEYDVSRGQYVGAVHLAPFIGFLHSPDGVMWSNVTLIPGTDKRPSLAIQDGGWLLVSQIDSCGPPGGRRGVASNTVIVQHFSPDVGATWISNPSLVAPFNSTACTFLEQPTVAVSPDTRGFYSVMYRFKPGGDFGDPSDVTLFSTQPTFTCANTPIPGDSANLVDGSCQSTANGGAILTLQGDQPPPAGGYVIAQNTEVVIEDGQIPLGSNESIQLFLPSGLPSAMDRNPLLTMNKSEEWDPLGTLIFFVPEEIIEEALQELSTSGNATLEYVLILLAGGGTLRDPETLFQRVNVTLVIVSSSSSDARSASTANMERMGDDGTYRHLTPTDHGSVVRVAIRGSECSSTDTSASSTSVSVLISTCDDGTGDGGAADGGDGTGSDALPYIIGGAAGGAVVLALCCLVVVVAAVLVIAALGIGGGGTTIAFSKSWDSKLMVDTEESGGVVQFSISDESSLEQRYSDVEGRSTSEDSFGGEDTSSESDEHEESSLSSDWLPTPSQVKKIHRDGGSDDEDDDDDDDDDESLSS